MLIRIGLIFLVLIAALPVLTVQVVSRLDARHSDRQEIASTALRLAALQAERISSLVGIAHGITTILVQLPSVLERNGPKCAERIEGVLDSLPQFVGLGAFAPDGTSFCQSGGDDPIFIGDRRYFREALQKRHFVGSGRSVGRLVQQPVIVFAMPAIDDAGELRAVVLLDYPLSRLSAFLQTEALPTGASVDLIDDDGLLMARLPTSGAEREATSASVLDRLRADPRADLWDEEVPGELPEALDQARRGEATRFLGSLHTASGRQMWWDISISPVADSRGRPERLLVVSRDMTELKRAEQHRELLMAELDHRVKNALAAIQSMARQTLDPGRPTHSSSASRRWRWRTASCRTAGGRAVR